MNTRRVRAAAPVQRMSFRKEETTRTSGAESSALPAASSSLTSAPAPAFAVRFPIRTVSEANMRGAWPARYRRTSKQRETVMLILGLRKTFSFPLTVKLTRLAPRMMDSDNAIISMKAVRDQCAKWLSIDDGDPRVMWSYAQENSTTYGVRFEVFQNG